MSILAIKEEVLPFPLDPAIWNDFKLLWGFPVWLRTQ